MGTHLHVHTVQSRYDAVSTCQEMVDQAIAHGHKALAITNHGLDSMGDLYQFQQYAKEKGIKPILGCEGYLVDELVTMEGKKRKRTHYNHIILLASNHQGWKNLCHLSYIANIDEEHFYYKPRNTFEELFQYKEGLVVGSACLASVFSQNVLAGKEEKAEEYFKRFVDELGENFYAEVQLNELVEEQKKYNDWIIKTAAKYNVPVVITGDCHYATPEGAQTQRFIFNLRKEEDSEGDDTYKCKSLFYQGIDDFKQFNKVWGYGYTDDQIEEWWANSDKIAEKCNFEIPLGIGMKLPRVCFDEEKEFTERARNGLAKHFNCEYKDCPEEYRNQLEHELEVLLLKGAYRYMLQLSSVISWAREQKYMVGSGRGSAGGSLTCACLGITSWAIDPIKFGLLFDRFVSSERLVSNMYKYYNNDWYVTKNRNYTFEDLKKIVAQKIREYPEYKERALKELRRAKWLDKEVSMYDEIMEVDCDDRYVLPFFLGKTDKVDLSKPLEIVQIKRGGSGGLDIDTDLEPKAKEAVKQMLIEKYGQSRVMGIGTYTNVGLASGIKDILRKCEVPFKESNDFCKELDDELSFEENMENYRKNFPELYQIYNQYKAYLDMTPKIMNNKKACIPGNQLVNTINGKKEMKEISSTDEIAYLDKSGNICYTKNFKKIWSGKKDVFEIELENGKKIRATEEHLFFTNNGLKKLKDLTEKDELIEVNCNKLEQIKIKSIKKVSNEDVYDIQNFEKDVFQNESNFIIDDILGHNCGQHAGGCLLLDDDVWNYIPVIHTKDGVATAFVESGSAAELDELGIIKYDFLAITVLEVISNAVDSVDEEIVKILDDDGIVKYVSRSYVDAHK